MRRAGFTIVELLIVIVVIGLLATIALAAFTDSQRQARNSQTTTAANAYAKAILAYAAENNGYFFHQNGSSCLGTYQWPSSYCHSQGNQTNSNWTMQQLAPYLPNPPPQPAMTVISNSRGILLGWNGVDRYLYFPIEDTGCPNINGTRMTTGVVTGGRICRAYFPINP